MLIAGVACGAAAAADRCAPSDGSGPGGRGSAGCDGGPCGAASSVLLDPSRTTKWNPGILADNQLHLPLGADGLPVRTTVCASPMPGADLNAALAACPADMVALLHRAKDWLDERDRPSGDNVGINVGRDAGQTVMHVHVHLIPRRTGDVAKPEGGVRNVIPGQRLSIPGPGPHSRYPLG